MIATEIRALALPNPADVTLTQIQEQVVPAIRAMRDTLLEQKDLRGAEELHRRTAAFSRYLRGKEAHKLIEVEQRRNEILIGKLLGPAEHEQDKGGRFTTSHVSEMVSIPKDDRYRFRVEAANSTEVEALVAEDVTSRSEILQALALKHKMPTPDLPRGERSTYEVIYADPPWRYEHASTPNRAIENQYPTMPLAELFFLQVPAAEASVLFLWATSPKLAEAIQLIDAWGFSYRSCAVWVKPSIGLGYYFRQRHEMLLVARRGDYPVPVQSARPDSVIEAARGGHSQKPEIVYEFIERMYPCANRIELFARQAREGWDRWGLEAPEGGAR
jgi:N6-adenosine-specific RNA methylase IME4